MARILVFTSVRREEIQLSLMQHDLFVIGDLLTARKQLFAFEPDLVLAEWHGVGRPDSGMTFLAQYRKVAHDMPRFVLMAGTVREGDAAALRVQALRSGADGFVSLPRSTDDREFAKAVDDQLARAKRRPWPLPARGTTRPVAMTVRTLPTAPEPAPEDPSAVIDALERAVNLQYRNRHQ